MLDVLLRLNPDRNLGNEEREKLATVGHGIIAEVDENYMPVRNRSNDYMIDREVQKNVSYTGVQGLAEQDIMVQQSQGFIVDRTRETLTQTDGCVVKFRRMVMEDAKRLADGEEPEAPGVIKNTAVAPAATSPPKARRWKTC